MMFKKATISNLGISVLPDLKISGFVVISCQYRINLCLSYYFDEILPLPSL